jgi:hypothetical protein
MAVVDAQTTLMKAMVSTGRLGTASRNQRARDRPPSNRLSDGAIILRNSTMMDKPT